MRMTEVTLSTRLFRRNISGLHEQNAGNVFFNTGTFFNQAKGSLKRREFILNFLNNKFALMILPAMLRSMSPVIVSQIRPLLEQLELAANSTENPWDNIFVEFLKGLLVDFAATLSDPETLQGK